MGRIRAFDIEEIEEKAMEFFWRNGYQAVAIEDLLSYVGISRSSLYSVWEGKEALFRTAFQRYLRTIGMDALHPLHRSAYPTDGLLNTLEPKEAIRQVFMTIARQISNDPLGRGCMMVNTITELSAVKPELAHLAHDAQDQVSSMFRSALQPLVDRGLWTESRAENSTGFLLTFFLGLRVLARSRPSLEHVDAMVKMALELLFV